MASVDADHHRPLHLGPLPQGCAQYRDGGACILLTRAEDANHEVGATEAFNLF
jgi:hypothetical protein